MMKTMGNGTSEGRLKGSRGFSLPRRRLRADLITASKYRMGYCKGDPNQLFSTTREEGEIVVNCGRGRSEQVDSGRCGSSRPDQLHQEARMGVTGGLLHRRPILLDYKQPLLETQRRRVDQEPSGSLVDDISTSSS